jgi:hypothetical protein
VDLRNIRFFYRVCAEGIRVCRITHGVAVKKWALDRNPTVVKRFTMQAGELFDNKTN